MNKVYDQVYYDQWNKVCDYVKDKISNKDWYYIYDKIHLSSNISDDSRQIKNEVWYSIREYLYGY